MSSFVAIHIYYFYDGENSPSAYSAGVDREDPFTLGQLYTLLAFKDRMLCVRCETAPQRDLNFNLAEAPTDRVEYDALPWSDDYQDLRDEVERLYAEHPEMQRESVFT